MVDASNCMPFRIFSRLCIGGDMGLEGLELLEKIEQLVLMRADYYLSPWWG